MKLINILIALAFLTGCYAPVHDDPDETNQVANFVGLWSGLKDFHFESTHNNYIDDLITNGDASDNLAGLVTENSPGCAVGVLQDSEITYLQTYGYATETSDWYMSTTTPVGSVSKTITAIAMMRMVEEGLMDLDDLIDEHVGNAGAFSGITIEQLLSLDAGVPAGAPPWNDTPACPNTFPGSATVDWCLSHPRVAFDAVKDDITLGAQVNKYSNISIMAAAAALDQTSYDSAEVDNDQRGYEAWVWHQLAHWAGNHFIEGEFTSMALAHSWRENDILNYADGFDCSGGCGMNPPQQPAWNDAGIYEGWWGPAGGWAMTIGDLARFAAIINTHGILAKQIDNNSWDVMFEQRNDVFDSLSGDDYGLGIIVENWGTGGVATTEGEPENEKVVWHGGDLFGYGSLWYYSEIDNDSYAVVLQCNGASAESNSFQLKEYAENIIAYARAGGDIHPTLDVTGGYATPQQASGQYLIDPNATHLVSPDSLHIPWLLDNEIRISVTPDGEAGLRYTLEEGKLSGRGVFIPTQANPIILGSYPYQPEAVTTTRALDIALQVNDQDMLIQDVVFDLQFARRGSHIAESSITGVLDLRQLDRFGVASNWQQLCRVSEVEDLIPCQPCDDDISACLAVAWNTQGVRMPAGRQ